MAVLEPDQHRRAGGGGLVVALQRLAGLDQREGLRGLDAERLEHLGREHLAHAALQRQPAVAEAAVGRLARSLGAEVEQPAAAVAQLREQEAAAVADVGIVHPELVAVIAQRQRLGEIVGQRLEAAEMADPFLVAQIRQADRRRPAVVAEAQDRLRESRPPRPDRRRRRRARGWRDRRDRGIAEARESSTSNPGLHGGFRRGA